MEKKGIIGLLSRFLGRKKIQSQQFPPQLVFFPKIQKQVPISLDLEKFCELVRDDKDCVFLLSLKEYKDATLRIMEFFKKQKNPIEFP
jgi:hypothetical protein